MQIQKSETIFQCLYCGSMFSNYREAREHEERRIRTNAILNEVHIGDTISASIWQAEDYYNREDVTVIEVSDKCVKSMILVEKSDRARVWIEPERIPKL